MKKKSTSAAYSNVRTFGAHGVIKKTQIEGGRQNPQSIAKPLENPSPKPIKPKFKTSGPKGVLVGSVFLIFYMVFIKFSIFLLMILINGDVQFASIYRIFRWRFTPPFI